MFHISVCLCGPILFDRLSNPIFGLQYYLLGLLLLLEFDDWKVLRWWLRKYHFLQQWWRNVNNDRMMPFQSWTNENYACKLPFLPRKRILAAWPTIITKNHQKTRKFDLCSNIFCKEWTIATVEKTLILFVSHLVQMME